MAKRISQLTALTSASLDTTLLGIDRGVSYKVELDVLADAVKDRINTLDGVRLSSLESFTASYTASVLSTGTISGSSQLTSSFDTRYTLSGSVANVNTASLVSRLNTIESVSGSWITESETGSFLTSLNGAISGSSQLTSSYDSRYSLSGSILTSFSQSVDSRLDNLENEISSSIEYINGNFEGYSALTPISGTFYKPTVISANNNIQYNSGSGLFRLNAGKTYMLEAYIPHGYYGMNNSISFQWKDTTNNIHIGTGASPRLSGGTWDGGLDIAKAIINTTQVTYVGIISTLNSSDQPNAYIITGQSYIFIQELGVGISNEVIVSGSTDFTQITNKPTLISGSSQLTSSLDTRYVASGSISATPAGTISGSAQITTLGFVSGSFLTSLSGAISSSSQLTSSYDTRYTLSGSVQPLPSNLLSSSAQITAFGFVSSSVTTPAGTISGSSQLTSSFDGRYTQTGSFNTLTASFNSFTASAQSVTTGSNSFNGTQTITGSLIITTGSFVASQILANTASLYLTSGSNLYVQNNGLVEITGSLTATSITGSIAATNGVISGSTQLTTAFPSKTTGTWSVPAGASTQSLSVEANSAYTMWVNGNIPNGIITWNATATTANTNVPVVGAQYGWYYAVGNALVLTAMPDQFTGTNGSILTTPGAYAPNTSNVFKFGITNNSGTTQTINYGYIKLS